MSITTTILGLTIATASSSALAQGTDARPVRQTPPTTPPTMSAPASPTVGSPAAPFELKDTEGKTHTLKQFRGKVVILEWFNGDCAEVRHQHKEGSLRSIMREFDKEGIVWLAINSTPMGQAGGGKDATMKARTDLAVRFPILLDETGVVAGLYAVKRAPTVFVIDEEGVLRYFGAIDNAPNGKLPEGAKLTSYLREALQSVLYDSQLATTRTEAYGCPIRPKVDG